MTICKNCGGSGWDDEHMIICTHCHGMGEVELTNEEWLNTLKLDTKAYWLANTCRKAMWEDKYDNNNEKSTLGYWKEWLKQPHSEE